MRVKLTQLVANKFRDLGKHPYNRQKIDALKESSKDTGVWRNLMGRPLGNEIEGVPPENLASFLETLEAAFTDDGPLFKVELPYGHHRWQAWLEMGVEEIDIQVIPIEDKTMLQMMANENKGDWGSNMSVILETVRQTRQFLMDQVLPYFGKTYEDYKAAYGDGVFFTKEQFAQIPEQGIGFKTIRKFLGETWAEGDIRNAVATLKSIDAGLFEQEQVITFPSIGVLGAFTKVAEGVMHQPWPQYFQRRAIDDIATMVADPAVSTTVKILKSAQDAVNNGKDPVRVVKNPGLKRVDFNVVSEVKDLVYENISPDAPKLEDLPELEGFKDFPDLPKIMEEVKKSIARSEAAKKAAEKGGPPAPDGAAPDQEALDEAIADAEAKAPATGMAPDFPDLPEGEATDAAALAATVDTFVNAVPNILTLMDQVGARLDQIDGSDHPVFAAAEELFKKTALLFIGIYSKQDAIAALDEIAE